MLCDGILDRMDSCNLRKYHPRRKDRRKNKGRAAKGWNNKKKKQRDKIED